MVTCPSCQFENPDGARFCSNCGAALDAPRPVEGERTFATVLFADVVRSTASERLARVHLERRELEAGRRHIGAALEYGSVGMKPSEARALELLAELEAQSGRTEESRHARDEAAALRSAFRLAPAGGSEP